MRKMKLAFFSCWLGNCILISNDKFSVSWNQFKARIKYVYYFASLFVILIFTAICILSNDFWRIKNPIYFGTTVNDIRKLILITKMNTTNNKVIYSYLIADERINSYALIHFLLLNLMHLCQFILLCLLFLGALIC